MCAVDFALMSQETARICESRELLTAFGRALVWSIVLVHVLTGTRSELLDMKMFTIKEYSLPFAFATKVLDFLRTSRPVAIESAICVFRDLTIRLRDCLGATTLR